MLTAAEAFRTGAQIEHLEALRVLLNRITLAEQLQQQANIIERRGGAMKYEGSFRPVHRRVAGAIHFQHPRRADADGQAAHPMDQKQSAECRTKRPTIAKSGCAAA